MACRVRCRYCPDGPTSGAHPYRGDQALYALVPEELLPKRPLWTSPSHIEHILRRMECVLRSMYWVPPVLAVSAHDEITLRCRLGYGVVQLPAGRYLDVA